MTIFTWTALWFFLLVIPASYAQTPASNQVFTIEQCISYALENRPEVKIAGIDEGITDRQIRASLSGWLPQVGVQYNLTHNFKLQTAAFGENLITIGRKNNSNILLQANQVLYSNELLLAVQGSSYARLRSELTTQEVKINTVVEVSKAFYDVLLSQKQYEILERNILRQEKQYNDAYARYEAGIVDKTDYQRASITLANSKSQQRTVRETMKAKYAYLKQVMGYPIESGITLRYDTEQMEQLIQIDTNQTVDYSRRVEYRNIQTQQQLLRLNTRFYQLEFLPDVSGFINYNWLYLNNDFSQLYTRSFPTSAAGLTAAIPIFQGTRRLQNIRIARYQEQRMEEVKANLERIMNTEYQSALANYKGNYTQWITVRENAAVAQEVYDIIKLQYDEGIKAYVDLIVAETELKAAELQMFNALYQLLTSKVDLERALGTIEVQ